MKSSICPAVFTLMFSALIASVDLCAQSSNVDPSREGLVKCALTVREPVFFRGTTNTNGFFVYPITFSATVRQPLPATAKTNQTAGEVIFSTKPENNRISTPNIIALATTNVPNPPRAMRLVAFLDQSGDPTLLNVANNGLAVVDATNLTNVVATVPASLLQIVPLSNQQRAGSFSQAMQLQGKFTEQTNSGTFTFTNSGAVTVSVLILNTFPAYGAVPSRERQFTFSFDSQTAGTNFVYTFGGAISGTYED